MRFVPRVVLSSAIFLALLTTKTFATSNDFYGSLIKAIDVADVQAHVTLDSGTWKSTLNGVDLVWSIPETTVPELGFHYLGGTIISDPVHNKITYIQFPSLPGPGGKKVNTFINVTVLKTTQGVKHCATFRIFRLEFDTGGSINGNSQVEPLPPTPTCANNASFFDLNAFLKLANNSDSMFRGRVFAGFGPGATVVRCRDAACTPARVANDTGPITEIHFFGVQNGISFYGNSEILFSKTASIILDPGSKVGVETLDYYVTSETGAAVLTNNIFAVKSGLIQVGTVILNLAENSKLGPTTLSFPRITLNKDSDVVKMMDGQLIAGLARGSILTLMDHPDNPSRVVVDLASANFLGLGFTFSNSQQQITARQATINASAIAATLGFSTSNSVVLGYSTMDLILGCEDLSRSEAECPGFSWSSGSIMLVGTMSNLSGSLTGGRFALGDAGYSNIKGGQFLAQALTVDTRNIGPVAGNVSVKNLDLSGENIWIDKSTMIRAASIMVDSEELEFLTSEKYPKGTLKVHGTVSEVTAGDFTNLELSSATIDATVGREAGKKPEVISGEIKAVLTLMDGSTASATANVTIRQIHYYDGSGSAVLDFTLASAKAIYDTDEQTWKGSGTFDKTTLKLDSVELVFTLAGPIEKDNVAIQVARSKWNIDPFTVPFTINLPLQDKELLYGIVESEPIGPNCTSHVKFIPHTYHITGNASVNLSKLSYSVDNFNMDQGVQVDVDDGSCGTIIKAACFIAGSVTPFGILGGVVAAVLCGKEIDKKKAELAQKINDESLNKVRSLHFHSTH